MDIKDLLTGSMAKQIGKAVGVDDDAVGVLLQKAVPVLLDSMNENSKKKDGAESLQKALLAHADDDVDDVKKIDTADGAKIIKHILGGNKASVTKDLAKAAGGLDADKVDDILTELDSVKVSLVRSAALNNWQYHCRTCSSLTSLQVELYLVVCVRNITQVLNILYSKLTRIEDCINNLDVVSLDILLLHLLQHCHSN